MSWKLLVPRCVQDGPRWPQVAQDSAKLAQKGSQDGHKMGEMSQDGSKIDPTGLHIAFLHVLGKSSSSMHHASTHQRYRPMHQRVSHLFTSTHHYLLACLGSVFFWLMSHLFKCQFCLSSYSLAVYLSTPRTANASRPRVQSFSNGTTWS